MPRVEKKSISNLCVLLVIIFAGFTAHSSMLGAPFKAMDDQVSIIDNPLIKDPARFGENFRVSFFGRKTYYRPLVSLSFMLEYFFFKENPFFYNLTNLFLHLATAIVIFFLLQKLFLERTLCFFVSLLFAVHPVHWEAIANIPGRAVLLCSFFTLNAFLFFLLSCDRGGRSVLFYILSLSSFFFALLSKESAVMLPLAILNYIFFFKPRDEKGWINILKFVAPYFAIVIFYLFLRKSLGITQVYFWPSFSEHFLGVATFLRSVLTSLRLFILPVDLHYDRSRILWQGINSPGLWATLAVYFITAFFLFKFRRSITKSAGFFFCWFLIELFPVSQVIAPICIQAGAISAAEHFLYMPSVGMFVLFVLSGKMLYEYAIKKKIAAARIILTGYVALYFCLFSVTVRQNSASTDGTVMFQKTLRFAPNNNRIRNCLALSLAKKKLFKEAEGHFRQVIAMDPSNVRARIGAGKALCDQGKYWEGIREYDKIQDAGSLDELLKDNVNLTLEILLNQYRARIAEDSDNARLYYSLGVVYSKAGKIKEAIIQYKKAVELDSRHKKALFNLASSYEAMGKREDAVTYYERMLVLSGEKDEMDKYAEARLQNFSQFRKNRK